jgi:hypothetical protein
MSKGLMRTSLQVVPKPPVVLPEHEDEIFVRLCFYEPGMETDVDPALAFTMPVSDLLRMLNGIAADLREIVHNDVGEAWPFPPSLFNPN